MSDRKKIVLLAIDAGDKVLIRNWVQDGILPNIRSLIEKGIIAGIARRSRGCMKGPPGHFFIRG